MLSFVFENKLSIKWTRLVFGGLTCMQHSIVDLMVVVMWISRFGEFQLDLAVDHQMLFCPRCKVSSFEQSVEVVVPLSTTKVCFCCLALVCLGLSFALVVVVTVSILVFLFLELERRLCRKSKSLHSVFHVFDSGRCYCVGLVKVHVEVSKRSWRREERSAGSSDNSGSQLFGRVKISVVRRFEV